MNRIRRTAEEKGYSISIWGKAEAGTHMLGGVCECKGRRTEGPPRFALLRQEEGSVVFGVRQNGLGFSSLILQLAPAFSKHQVPWLFKTQSVKREDPCKAFPP